MIPDEVVTRFLRSAPDLTAPDAVKARLRAVIAEEVELRRASAVEPAVEMPEIKHPSRLWTEDPVTDA